ncbi:glucan biosynthesis protein, partial [Pyxidicoccus sp. 3LG]
RPGRARLRRHRHAHRGGGCGGRAALRPRLLSHGGAGDAPVDIDITASKGQVLRRTVQRHEPSGGWRATFEWVPDASAPSELRAYLRRGSETLTETWSYLWTP